MQETQSEWLPDVLMFVSPDCVHCTSVLKSMRMLLKENRIANLEIINAAAQREQAAALGIKSVPWVRIGQFELEGLITPDILRQWVEQSLSPKGVQAYFMEMLTTGRRDKVEKLIRNNPSGAEVLVELLVDPEASMAVRIGMGAVLEELQGSGLTDSMIPGLGNLLLNGDSLIRVDACHFLTLIGGAAVTDYMKLCLEDENADIREMAHETLGINQV